MSPTERMEYDTTPAININPFGFHAKTKHDANESLIKVRSAKFRRKNKIKDEDIWEKPPPDFRPQIFAPNAPKRNSRESMKPWLFGTVPGHKNIKRPEKTVLPFVLQSRPEAEKVIVTRFRTDRPFTAKKKAVREGKIKEESYVMPQPHDFRQYPNIKKLGLPEFLVDYEKDPFNIRFHTERLNTIHVGSLDKATGFEAKGQQMAPPKSPGPKFENVLILKKEQWPTKPAAYTRFPLRYRPAHSAFLERVTRTLQDSWEKSESKYEKQKTMVPTS